MTIRLICTEDWGETAESDNVQGTQTHGGIGQTSQAEEGHSTESGVPGTAMHRRGGAHQPV
jgi:hypothetical protein